VAAEDNLMLEAIVVAQQKTEDMLDQTIECMDGLYVCLAPRNNR